MRRFNEAPHPVLKSVLSGTLDAMFLVVTTEWLSCFRSYGFMERAENILAVTGSLRWSSSRMPGAWVTLRPLSSSGLVPDGAPTSFPVLQPAAVLYLILCASLPCPQFAPLSFSTPALPDNVDNVGEPCHREPKESCIPTCGADPGEKYELSAGQPRTGPHRDRRLIAKDSPT